MHFGKHLVISCKHTLPYDLTNPLLDTHPKEMKIHIHSKTCIWIFLRSFIHNSPKLETAQMSTIWWRDKHVVYPYKRILFSDKKKLIQETEGVNFKTETIYFILPFIWNSRKGQTAVLETYQHCYLGARSRRRGLAAESCEGNFV